MINRGEIWLANLNPSKGTEPGKTRPVLVIQTQALLNVGHSSTLIIPLTTRLIDDMFPLRVRIMKQEKLMENSDALIDQVRAIDNKRLIEGPLTQLSNKEMENISNAIAELVL